jgi:uncharacterized protein YutD
MDAQLNHIRVDIVRLLLDKEVTVDQINEMVDEAIKDAFYAETLTATGQEDILEDYDRRYLL